MGLLDLYNLQPETSQVGKIRDTVATVADGDDGVNFFDKTATFQKNFKERKHNNTIVTQSTEDDKTNGNFTDKALKFHADSYTASSDKALHSYYQRNNKTWYAAKNATSKGVVQSYSIK